MKKYAISIFLFLVFFLNINFVSAEDYIFSSDFAYILDSSGNASIVAYTGNNTDLTIPSSIDGHKVTTIARHAFDEHNPYDIKKSGTKCSSIKNLVISEGITKVDDFAFVKCTNIETVKLPQSLTYLGWQVFLGCKKLKSINIPNKITELYPNVFQETALTSIVIPKNVKKFGSHAFAYCSDLKDVYIYNDDIVFFENHFLAENPFYEIKNLNLHANVGSTTEEFSEIFYIKEDSKFKFIPLNQDYQKNDEFESLSTQTEEQPQSTEIKMTRIILNKTILTLTEGDTETLSATIQPENATNKDLIWSSSNINIAKIENGKVTAKNAGTAKIKVSNKDNTVSAECNVTVMEKAPLEIPMKKIEVNKLTLKMKVGDKETIVAKILPENSTEKDIYWSVANNKSKVQVVKVDNGTITALNKGTAVVSVSNKSKKVITKISVTVLEADNNGEEIKMTKINMNKPSLNLKIGEKETLIAGILPSNATNKELIWTSSDTSIVTVENGKVSAVGKGEAIITVTNKDGTVEAKSNIKVLEASDEEIPLKKIVINRTEMSLYVGNEQLLVASLIPGNATDTEVYWSSSNEKVAKVEEGRVIATGIGGAVITITNKDKTVSATCDVIVTDLLDEERESFIDFDFIKILAIGVGVLLLFGFLIKIGKN